jgi:hypothetical protein
VIIPIVAGVGAVVLVVLVVGGVCVYRRKYSAVARSEI